MDYTKGQTYAINGDDLIYLGEQLEDGYGSHVFADDAGNEVLVPFTDEEAEARRPAPEA